MPNNHIEDDKLITVTTEDFERMGVKVYSIDDKFEDLPKEAQEGIKAMAETFADKMESDFLKFIANNAHLAETKR